MKETEQAQASRMAAFRAGLSPSSQQRPEHERLRRDAPLYDPAVQRHHRPAPGGPGQLTEHVHHGVPGHVVPVKHRLEGQGPPEENFGVRPCYHITKERIKKYYPLDLLSMCREIGIGKTGFGAGPPGQRSPPPGAGR